MSADLDRQPIPLPHDGSYRLDISASSAAFTVRHLFGLGTVSGTIPLVSGAVVVAGGRASVLAALDPAGFATGNPRRDKDIRGARFLDAARFPEMAYTGALDGSQVRGTLAAHGESAATILRVREVDSSAERIVVVAETRVDRCAHGITGGRGMVGRYLDVRLRLTFVPE